MVLYCIPRWGLDLTALHSKSAAQATRHPTCPYAMTLAAPKGDVPFRDSCSAHLEHEIRPQVSIVSCAKLSTGLYAGGHDLGTPRGKHDGRRRQWLSKLWSSFYSQYRGFSADVSRASKSGDRGPPRKTLGTRSPATATEQRQTRR